MHTHIHTHTPFFSFFLSHTRTHILTHTHTHTHSHMLTGVATVGTFHVMLIQFTLICTRARTRTLSLPFSFTHACTLPHILAHTYSLSCTHRRVFGGHFSCDADPIHTYVHTHTHTVALFLSHTRMHTHTRTYTHTHPLSHTQA